MDCMGILGGCFRSILNGDLNASSSSISRMDNSSADSSSAVESGEFSVDYLHHGSGESCRTQFQGESRHAIDLLLVDCRLEGGGRGVVPCRSPSWNCRHNRHFGVRERWGWLGSSACNPDNLSHGLKRWWKS